MADNNWRFLEMSKKMQAEKLAMISLQNENLTGISPRKLAELYVDKCKEIYQVIKNFEFEN